MVVRIRFARGLVVARKAGKNLHIASVLGGLFSMVAVSFAMLALWRGTSDLGWTDTFFITDGIFSHSQVWIGLTVAAAYPAIRLLRYARLSEQKLREQAQGDAASLAETADVESQPSR